MSCANTSGFSFFTDLFITLLNLSEHAPLGDYSSNFSATMGMPYISFPTNSCIGADPSSIRIEITNTSADETVDEPNH